MRQLTPLTNLMLSCISALGLLLSLELPWYAHPAVDVPDGRVEAVGAQIARTFTSGDTISGSDVLGSRSTLLYIVAAVVIALSIAMLVPALREPFRDMLRGISLVSPL